MYMAITPIIAPWLWHLLPLPDWPVTHPATEYTNPRWFHLQIFRTEVMTVHVDGREKYRLHLVVSKLIRRLVGSKQNLTIYQYNIHRITVMSFAISLYGQCWRRHVVGQQVVCDMSVVHSCCSICSLCSESTIMLICHYARLLVAVLKTSFLLHILNITWPTTWQCVLGEDRERIIVTSLHLINNMQFE